MAPTEVTALVNNRLKVSPAQIGEFCQRWQIIELALFGSILRRDFCPDSDIDVLVTFSPNAKWSLLDWVDMKEDLTALFGREVDIADKEGLKNPYRGSAQGQSHHKLAFGEQSPTPQ